MKSGRTKQNNPNATNGQFISSTYRVEADQKEIIIKNLKGQVENLRKNEGQFHKLNDKYKQLQHKYRLLSDDKGNEDREFKMRHEAAVRSIGQLKNEIDALRAEVRDKKVQINDLDSDYNQLKNQLDERSIELENLRNDQKGCIADNQQLGGQRESLQNTANKLRLIISQGQEESKLLKQDNDSVNKRLEQLEKYQQQLLLQQKILREKIQGYENQNNQLDQSISDICDHLNELELSIKKAQEDYSQLQRATAEVNLMNQKHKSEVQHVQKSIQAQILKNNAFLKNLKNAQYTLKVRTGQVEEGDKQISALKEQKDGLAHINNKLAEDLQACRIHLQNLGLLNSKLVEHLQTFSEQDQSVRELITRQPRVEYHKNRVGEVESCYKSTGLTKFIEESKSSSRRQYR